MEWNKKRVTIAMQLSEKMNEDNDFAGAREMAQVAHRLLPEDKNIQDLLALSEVCYSIFEFGEGCETGDTARADFQDKVSRSSGNLTDDNEDDEDDDHDEDDEDDSDYDADADNNDEVDDIDDFVIAPKRLRERKLSSATEKQKKKAMGGRVSRSIVRPPKRLRLSELLSATDEVQKRFKDHDSLNSMSSPPAQFYDFNALKTEENFRVGQIWALYSDGDGMPKTYAQVKRIIVKPNKAVQRVVSSQHLHLCMGLLVPSLEPKNMVEPVCCGTFKVKRAPPMIYSVASLSHPIKAKFLEKNMFEITPRRGEVWALYKKHNSGECEVVEVVEDEPMSTKVVVLTPVKGFESVFKAPTLQKPKTGVIDILRNELSRFSHQISAFKHTRRSYSELAGCWELDPLSFPGNEKDVAPKSDPPSPPHSLDGFLDIGDVMINTSSSNTESNGASSELIEVKDKPVVGSLSIQAGIEQEETFAEREESERVESQVCDFTSFGKNLAGTVKLEASQCVNALENGIHNTKEGNFLNQRQLLFHS